MTAATLTATLALTGACSKPSPIVTRVKAAVVTPSPTSSMGPTPRPTARPTPEATTPTKRSVAGPRHDDVGGIPFIWMEVADCESGDGPKAFGPPFNPHWAYHGSDYDGGLNFTYDTWDDAWAWAKTIKLIGKDVPSGDAWQHSAQRQVQIAIAWQSHTSWGQWPACSEAIGLR